MQSEGGRKEGRLHRSSEASAAVLARSFEDDRKPVKGWKSLSYICCFQEFMLVSLSIPLPFKGGLGPSFGLRWTSRMKMYIQILVLSLTSWVFLALTFFNLTFLTCSLGNFWERLVSHLVNIYRLFQTLRSQPRVKKVNQAWFCSPGIHSLVSDLDDRDAEGAIVTERVNESANGQEKASPKRRHL